MAVPAWASVIIALGTFLVLGVSAEIFYNRLTRKPFKPAGKHAFITGGSTGLGKALAIELVKKGSHVTIVARRQAELDSAVEEIKAARVSDTQRVVCVSADVTNKMDVVRALEEAKVKVGMDPDFVFTCAGAAYPKPFLELELDDFERSMRLNYLGQLFVAHQAASRMRDANIQGKIVFVSSMLGLLSFTGYSTYSPTKFALRGLADTLRNELKRYNIDVHIFFPGNIDSPGFVTENATKPKVTKDIEGASQPASPKDCALALYNGIAAGHYMITNELVGEVLRCATRGVNPSNSFILDSIMAMIAQPVGSIYALFADYMVRHAKDD